MAQGRKTPGEVPELRSAAPHQRGPLGSSGAAPSESDKSDVGVPESTVQPGGEPVAKGEIPTQRSAPDAEPVVSGPAGAASEKPEPRKADDEKPAAEKAEDEKPTPTKAEDEKPAPAKAEDGKPAPAKGEDGKPAAAKGEEPAAGKDGTDGDKAKNAASKDLGAAGKGDESKDALAKTAVAAAPVAVATAPVAVALAGKETRRFRPLAAVGRGGRATAAWARGPVGRVILPGLVVVGLVVLAGTSGAYLVPRALEAAAPTATPTFTDQSGAPSAGWSDPAIPGAPGTVTGTVPGAPGGTLPATGLPTVQPTATGARPADALASWAQQVGTRVGIPVVAVQAYGYAELVTAKTTPSCRLSWTTLAAIGKIESGHGSHEGAVLGVDGVTQPPIRGLPLDGQGGRQLIRDTDRGTLDGDTTYDRAVGPMQFIPATWQATAIDADNNGVKDPNDIDDAAMTAAAYLCTGGRDLSRADSWWDAVLTYNDVRQYAQDVFNAANDYGLRSRT